MDTTRPPAPKISARRHRKYQPAAMDKTRPPAPKRSAGLVKTRWVFSGCEHDDSYLNLAVLVLEDAVVDLCLKFHFQMIISIEQKSVLVRIR
jgi:hypothetical protein